MNVSTEKISNPKMFVMDSVSEEVRLVTLGAGGKGNTAESHRQQVFNLAENPTHILYLKKPQRQIRS